MPADSDLQQEIEQLEQRYAENPDGLVFAHLADAYRKVGEYSKAEGLVLHGLKAHPTYISGHNVLGRIYQDAERFADAHEQFNKVLELDPQNMIALRALADLAMNGGRLEDARSWYEKILAIDPRNEEAREGLEMLDSGGVPAAPAVAPVEPPFVDEGPGISEIELDVEAGSLEEVDLDALDLEVPGIESLDADLDVDGLESDLEVEALDSDIQVGDGGAEASLEALEELSPEEDFEPVEGLVNKETMTQSREDVLQDPEVESASKLTQQEFVGDEAEGPAEAPWEDIAELDALDGGDEIADPDVVAGAGAAADAFTDSMLEGLAAADPTSDVESDADAIDLDLKEMEDWTPGFLQDDDLTPDKGAALGAEAILDDADGEFSFDFGDATPPEPVEPEPSAIALGVYRKLAEARPDDERLQERIYELEEKLADESDQPAAGFELSELLELGEPRVPADLEQEAVPAADFSLDFSEAEPQAEAPPAAADFLAEPAAPAEPIADAEPEPSFTEPEPATPAPVAAEGEFSFADEAPVAGFDQLDPFAASFDVMVQRDGQYAEPPPASEPEFEGPVPVTVDGLPMKDPGILPPGADIQPAPGLVAPEPEPEPEPTPEFVEPEPSFAEPSFAEPSFDEPAFDEPAAAPQPALSEAGAMPTIEEYLEGLLTYDPEAPKPSPETPAAPAAADAPPADDSSPGGDDNEDLEQFQEWLRGLKS
jgi:tetratricopeptide (TPR) repeat protein